MSLSLNVKNHVGSKIDQLCIVPNLEYTKLITLEKKYFLTKFQNLIIKK